jgi:hypothetical protein
MQNKYQQISIVQWSARIIGIVFAAFTSIFAADVFSEGYDMPHTLLALFMHLIPTFLIVIVLVVAWRREWIGGVAFLVLGIFYFFSKFGKISWQGFAIIATPLFALAILFFIGWYQRTHARQSGLN